VDTLFEDHDHFVGLGFHVRGIVSCLLANICITLGVFQHISMFSPKCLMKGCSQEMHPSSKIWKHGEKVEVHAVQKQGKRNSLGS
jgi:hypothetical protein